MEGGSQWPPHSTWYPGAGVLSAWAPVEDWEVDDSGCIPRPRAGCGAQRPQANKSPELQMEPLFYNSSGSPSAAPEETKF